MFFNVKILVAARDASFGRSLAFVLEAEGGQVALVEDLSGLDGLPGRYDCLVIDHGALAGNSGESKALMRLGVPVVILTSRAQGMVGMGFAQVVEKPLLGRQLVEAVHHALASEHGKASPT